ncbi:hypothetical protein [Paracoccus mutanolyticus]|uniref:hypothetical protein n=1 Tax=Paracoccus mutanolyticus TaxID=1499308 RepID=UPI00295005E9|nr:hypothetical protein [Paracoccus mutanolyticus]
MITDFENGDDRIDLSYYARFDSFADIRGAAVQSGDSVVINAGAGAPLCDPVARWPRGCNPTIPPMIRAASRSRCWTGCCTARAMR